MEGGINGKIVPGLIYGRISRDKFLPLITGTGRLKEPALAGVYVWTITLVSAEGKPETGKGVVTLVR
ncbi:MAG: hypothetical protein KGM16_15670 [Bacteroidota bacterium]|nr:hypothetical protein [Bacteroidota bacterium]